MSARRSALLVLLAVAAAGCGAKSVDVAILSSPNDKVVWEAGQKAYDKKDWASARQYFKRIVDAFPQSERQADARIGVGDSYFEEGGTGNYVLAASAYKEFLTLYPQHPRSDYAQFRAAESYYKQRNSPDRDQTQTHKALEEYEKLLDIYPESRYVEETRARIKACRQTLARGHYLVGYYYQRGRQAWRSAIGRYEAVLNEYPDYERLDEVLYRYAECLAASGRYAEALPQLARLESEYPQSEYLSNIPKLRATFPPISTPAAPAPPPNQAATPGAPAGTTAAQGKPQAAPSAGDGAVVPSPRDKPASAPPTRPPSP